MLSCIYKTEGSYHSRKTLRRYGRHHTDPGNMKLRKIRYTQQPTIQPLKSQIWKENAKYWTIKINKRKAKQSRNRPGVGHRLSGGLGSQISWHSAREGGEVSLTHRPHLHPGMFLVLIFTRGWVDSRAMVRLEEICHWEIDRGALRLVAQHFNHYATPGPLNINTYHKTEQKRKMSKTPTQYCTSQ